MATPPDFWWRNSSFLTTKAAANRHSLTPECRNLEHCNVKVDVYIKAANLDITYSRVVRQQGTLPTIEVIVVQDCFVGFLSFFYMQISQIVLYVMIPNWVSCSGVLIMLALINITTATANLRQERSPPALQLVVADVTIETTPKRLAFAETPRPTYVPPTSTPGIINPLKVAQK
ncbi:hypothetical protein DAPPUDRAFT_252913 [Daphnia pulex]|uniref:Uncharacterized protein n=1 Tax=Daphnia pulex TaxID=6669 RepID=E9H3S5_DAPPU|nr:hypothetical protein DAPPUDRAFT_252913 [Daphnia pulex]|eukprot:EFX73572.1 hypothetical protein DAPPUDRAFT_252913 [Daphnia pulex]